MDLRPVPLTSLPDEEYYPSFSSDGNKVALTWNGEKGDNYDIYVKQIGSGTRPLRLTTNPDFDAAPAWSPDDQYIAFVRFGQTASALLLVPPLGGPERTVAALAADTIGGPFAWTPDSKWLAASLRESTQSPPGIWLISVNTGSAAASLSRSFQKYADVFWPAGYSILPMALLSLLSKSFRSCRLNFHSNRLAADSQ